ncbi:MAG: tetratricopeptide repeat protein, partial [Verrucomicrobiota bacterium]|nr:tetratricopeptide repeat protein [Verrucomicrobiota bacterium]
LEGSAQKYEARGIYEDLVATQKDNPFADASRLSLALLLKEANRPADALKQIQTLATQTENPELKAESSVRAGLWLLELGQTKKAEAALEAALKLPALGAWREVARVGLFQIQFSAGQYKELISSYRQSAAEFSPQVRPQLLVLVANAHRQLSQQAEALPLYDEVLRDAPNTPSAKEAAYERLVCLYQIDSANILPEVEQFLERNGDSPKRDHALLMKAEVLFKKQDYAAAVAVYDMLDESRHLPGDLKAKALFKLGWCHLQTREHQRAIKAFSDLVQDFPSSDSVASATFHRGLARLRLNDLKDAAKDFDQVIAKFPKCKEREPALEQKALILGKLNDNAGMTEAYKLLLTDYPKTSAAADANYWIGWVAFESKDYKNAPSPLDQARKLDQERYFERASLRILLAKYYTEEWDALGQEIDFYMKGGGKGQVPEEVLRGTATHYFDVAERASRTGKTIDTASFTLAAKYFAAVTARDDAKPEDFLRLGQSRYFLGQHAESVEALTTYLNGVRDRPARALGLLTLARSQIGLKDLDAAQKSVDEAISLQADGKVNAEARISWGDIEMARGLIEAAGKTYESVSVIIDDEEITPRALEKALGAYAQAGRDVDAKRLMNTLKSRYPEYYQGSKKSR